ncbi:MAG: hypothetical protein QOE55_1669 [Acidobacteriaceae bacterium]|nr:hypothetical protein [Acidobacteriaceae bacterium]
MAALILFVPSGLPQSQSDQNLSANDLVRQVIAHELQMQDQQHTHWMYEVETVKAGVKETKEVAGTKDGTVSLLVARNGQPLPEDERKKQEQQMNAFIHDSAEREKRKHAAEEDAAKTKRLLSMLPDAFTFTYEQGGEDMGGAVRLNFQPNPAYHPSSREAQVFHEMEGTLTVDRKEKRLAEINGKLMNEVKFFGGVLGHLDRGGTFDVRQARVGEDTWEIVRLNVNMKGKALFFKTISVQQDETYSHFQQLPENITLAEAGELLVKQATHR